MKRGLGVDVPEGGLEDMMRKEVRGLSGAEGGALCDGN